MESFSFFFFSPKIQRKNQYKNTLLNSGELRNNKKVKRIFSINPLSADVEYTPHDGDVICSGYSASYRQNH